MWNVPIHPYIFHNSFPGSAGVQNAVDLNCFAKQQIVQVNIYCSWKLLWIRTSDKQIHNELVELRRWWIHSLWSYSTALVDS